MLGLTISGLKTTEDWGNETTDDWGKKFIIMLGNTRSKKCFSASLMILNINQNFCMTKNTKGKQIRLVHYH